MGGLSKQFNKVRQILKKKGNKSKILDLECGSKSGSCTESLVEQLEEAYDVTIVTLTDSLQRFDNVKIFTALKKLVLSPKCKLEVVRLKEPNVRAAEYKRWCFKRTNFLHHCYQLCKEREIRLLIDATLVLDTPEGKPQDVSSWLSTHFPKTIPEDPDLNSIKIRLHALNSSKDQQVYSVFQALIVTLINCQRRWKRIECGVIYATVPKNAVPQTEALMEVAETYRAPLLVRWQPLDGANPRGSWTRTSTAAQVLFPQPHNISTGKGWPVTGSVMVQKALEDTTASTVCCEGSSSVF